VQAWIDDGTGPTRLGFYGGEYTRSNGDEESGIRYLTDTGVAIGRSLRYGEWNGREIFSQEYWVDDGTGPTRIGLYGPGFQSTTHGREWALVREINSSGLALGISDAYSGSSVIGDVHWLDDGTGAVAIGPQAGSPNFVAGSQFDYEVRHLSDSGYAAGVGRWYDPATSQTAARAAWIDDGTGPIRVGLTGGIYGTTASNGGGASDVLAISDNNHVVGNATVFNGTAPNHLLIDDGTGARRLGITGPGYDIVPFNALGSRLVDHNDAGQVIGTSLAFNGFTTLGQTAWFYDWDTDTTTELSFSLNADGFAETDLQYLTDDGTVYGTYKEFDNGTHVATQLFSWDMDNGVTNIFEVTDNLDDIAIFRQLVSVNDQGDVVIEGFSDTEGPAYAAFLLTPFLMGDMDGTMELTDDDITAFVQVFEDPDAYASAYPDVDPDTVGDFDNDGTLTQADVPGFEALMRANGSSELALAPLQLIPEPSSLALLSLGGLFVLRRRRA